MMRVRESGYDMTEVGAALDGGIRRRLGAAGWSDDPMCDDYDMMREQSEAER